MLMWLRALSHEGCRQANRLAGRQAEAGGQAAQVEVLRARIICFVMWSVMCSAVSYVVSYVVSCVVSWSVMWSVGAADRPRVSELFKYCFLEVSFSRLFPVFLPSVEGALLATEAYVGTR